MKCGDLLARSFSKHEQKKLRYGALVGFFFLSLSFCTFLKPFFGPLQDLNSQLSMEAYETLPIVNVTSSSVVTAEVADVLPDAAMVAKTPPMFNDTRVSQEMIRLNDDADVLKDKILPVICKIMARSGFCEITGDIRIDGISSTVYIVVPSDMDLSANANTSWRIKPYARKYDDISMSLVREWFVKLVTDDSDVPKCTQNHNVPAVLFSAGGYSYNQFHSFTEIIIPLFATSRLFNQEVQFLITDRKPWWVSKFATILKGLSKYELIDIDKEQDTQCFPSATVGLKREYDKELNIDPSISAYSIQDFRQFLRTSYSLKKTSANRIHDRKNQTPPHVLIIARNRTRRFTNVREIAKTAERLGCSVVVAEPDKDMSRTAQTINACDIMVGVHGAGLTNMVFLPENAILIQVVPLGMPKWLPFVSYEEPTKDMNIRYLEYKIKIEESTLIDEFARDHVVLKDPKVIRDKGWGPFQQMYLNKQSVKLDVKRFRPTLLKALELLHQ